MTQADKPKKEHASEWIIAASFEAAKTMPWAQMSLSDIAEAAGRPMAELRDMVDDKTDILVLYGRKLDRKVLENCAKPDYAESEKDRLFEVLMERFDILNQDREAVLSILDSLKSDPKALVISFPHIKHSMAWMMEAAGVSSSGWRGLAKLALLTGLYLNVVRQWKNDDSADLSKTMAALDKALDRFIKCGNMV